MTHNKADRKQRANKLLATRNERTPQQQIDLLDKRLGKGVGAKKERTRLNQQLKSGHVQKPAV